MTEIGKRIRLERIFNRKTGRTVIAPMDHGVSSGPIKGIISYGPWCIKWSNQRNN